MDKNQAKILQPAPDQAERPIPPEIDPVIDSNLARDHVEYDLLATDLWGLQ